MQRSSADFGLLLIRLVLATVFIYHGSQKLFGCFDGPGIQNTMKFMESLQIPYPQISALLAGSAEFFGGIVLVLGTGTRIAALFMAFTMAVAVSKVHFGAFGADKHGMEYPLTLGVVLLALVLIGPGAITISRLFKGKGVSLKSGKE